MKSLYYMLTISGAIVGTSFGADTSPPKSEESHSAARISRVESMPNLPQPLSIRDWSQVTRNYVNFLFDFDRAGPHLPLIRWMDDEHSMVSMPAYIGGARESEAINYLAAVVSGSLIGVDMRDFHGQDWVKLGTNFYNPTEGVYVNRLAAKTGRSFWYDVFPNVLFYQVNALYPEDRQRDDQARTVAIKWHDACVALGGKSDPPALPDFDHTGFDLATMQPTESGWIEPEAAAGIAWLEYMAWLKFQDPRFLMAADWALRALDERPDEQSPLYEVLLPYGALAAARMNAERGTNYDVDKLLNQCFDPHGRPQARPGWGVLSDRWKGQDVHGLVGSTTDGEGYAFAMNTFQCAGAIAPLARYDTRYARDIGKWMLNLSNAARLFYPDAHVAECQSSHAWATVHDVESSVAYEGIRKWKRGAAMAKADHSTKGGRIVQGSFASTHSRREVPLCAEVFEENCGDGETFEHIWEIELPSAAKRWLVVAAERVDGGHLGNAFRFSYASNPDGPYTSAFSVFGVDAPQVVELPDSLDGTLYVKAESNGRSSAWNGQDQLLVDAIAISFQSDIGPYAQGDQMVTFVALLDEATSPIVLYRPADATTDLGLYGSSHVGILGGSVRTTNVAGVLQLDLLKTDYYHAEAYPTYLYFNPHGVEKSVTLPLGSKSYDLYDAVTDQVIQSKATGNATFALPPDSARVVVIAPAGGTLRRDGRKTLIDEIVVRY